VNASEGRQATRPVEVYVSPHGNAFMVDIASWLVEAAGEDGRTSRLVTDGSLPGEGASEAVALVLAPHEFYELSTRSKRALVAAASRSIPIGTEQPGTGWFERSLWWSRHASLALDINPVGAEAAVAAGLDARLLQLGAVPSMTHPGGVRDVDVVALAGLTDHRARRLASLAPTLAQHRCELRLFPTGRPVEQSTAGGAGPVFGDAKYELLARSRLMLNLHRDDSSAYFEWARAVEAMANGCVIVTEPSAELAPLVNGEHLVVTDDPAIAIRDLLADPARRNHIADTAQRFVTGPLALGNTLGRLLDEIEQAKVEPATSRSGIGAVARALAAPSTDGPARVRPAFRPHAVLRRKLLDAVVAERSLRRAIDAERCRLRFGQGDHIDVVDSASWGSATADVSAIVTLFDYADLVTDTLDSVVASTGVSVEIVVVDDHSTDASREVVRAWIETHPDVAVRSVGRNANRGLAAARNLALEHARAELVMVLDADNLVYPRCIERLADALDDDPDALFAWSILERFGAETGLLSAHAWDARRLAERNQIDAQVMVRRTALADLGGYRELSGMLLGWEDWDLWLRVMASGRRGVLVPEILGRYRVQEGSMVTGANRFTDVMLERFEAEHPMIDFPQR